MKLYEFSALVEYTAVVAAKNEKDARTAIETWENAWHDTGDFSGVASVTLSDIKNVEPEDDLDDIAHEVVRGKR